MGLNYFLSLLKMDSTYRVYTYATHSHGLFDELVTNPFCEVRVVGFGEPWGGFMDKFKGMRSALDEDGVPGDELVIFVDGFDSRIRGDPSVTVACYLAHYPERPVVCSMNTLLPLFDSIIFGGDLNSGMYIGPADKIRAVLDACLRTDERDDQRCLNRVRREGLAGVPIEVDREKRLFRNLEYSEREGKCTSEKFDVMFISCPGELSLSRISRAVTEYVPYLWREIAVAVLALVALWLALRKVGSEHRRK